MRAPSRFSLSISFLALVAMLGLIWWQASPPPTEPASVTPVSPAANFVDAEASADFYATHIRHNPDDIEAHVALAQVYLQLAAETGREPDYVPRAEDVLAKALDRAPQHYGARVMQAALFNTLHQFEAARDLARTLIAENDMHAYTYGILVDALVELGDYDAAVTVCDQMLALKPSLASYARASYLRELHGDTDGAIEAMQLAVNAGMTGSADRAWALYNLANLYLGANDVDAAERLYQGILEERPDYALARGGLGHVAHLRGETTTALRLLHAAYLQQPRDVFLERLVEIYALAERPADVAPLVDKLYASYEEAAAMGENVDMEIADFLADHDRELDRALRLARTAYERRPDHLHALETYAWALQKHDRSAEAIPLMEQAMRLGTGDAMVEYRAAIIYLSAGQLAQARTTLQRALDNHLHIESPTAAAHAETLLAEVG